jgi:hypothetical protein
MVVLINGSLPVPGRLEPVFARSLAKYEVPVPWRRIQGHWPVDHDMIRLTFGLPNMWSVDIIGLSPKRRRDITIACERRYDHA